MNGRQVTEQFLQPTQEILGRVDLVAVHARLREWTRGGLPASSIPSGSRGGSPGMLELDRWDRHALLAWRKAVHVAHSEWVGAQHLYRFYNSMMEIAPPLPEAPVVPCANLACTNVLEAGRKSGECSTCRVRRHREQRTA